MKKTNLISMGLGIIILVSILAFSSADQATEKYEYKQVTTLESVVGAGFGRSSVMETTNSTSNVLSDYELKNFFSAAGINMGNVQTNEQTIVKIISDMQAEGWELFTITSTALNTETKRQGIFITRYLFRQKSKN